MSLSVVIPALNEAEAIAETVRKVRQTLTDAGETDFEIIVVDDGSTDGTGQIALAEDARVIRHIHNLGYGFSLKDGVRAARYNAIAITDADGTYPIQDLPKLLAHYRDGYHMVVGQRTGKEYEESVVKAPMRMLLRWLVEFTSSRKIPDINSGLRIFNRDFALQFEDRLCDTFSYTTSLTLAFIMNSRFVTYVPIDYYPRIGPTKVRLFKDSLKTLQYISEAAVFYNPVRIFGAMSLLLVVFSMLLLAANIFIRSNGMFLLSVGSILVSMVIFAMGLLAVVLTKILGRSAGAAAPLSGVVELAPTSKATRTVTTGERRTTGPESPAKRATAD